MARQEATVTLDLGEEAGKVWSVVTTQDQIIAAGTGANCASGQTTRTR